MCLKNVLQRITCVKPYKKSSLAKLPAHIFITYTVEEEGEFSSKITSCFNQYIYKFIHITPFLISFDDAYESYTVSIGVCHRTISIEGSAIISSEQYLNKDNTKSIMRSGNPQQLHMSPQYAKRKNIEKVRKNIEKARRNTSFCLCISINLYIA